MKIIDVFPIVVIVAALLVNIAIGASTGVSFSVLMIRCIFVTIVFGILSYMMAKTIENAAEYSRLSKLSKEKDNEAESGENQDNGGNESSFDIKVPPLDDAELFRIKSNTDNDFVEVSPVQMKGYSKSEQE